MNSNDIPLRFRHFLFYAKTGIRCGGQTGRTVNPWSLYKLPPKPDTIKTTCAVLKQKTVREIFDEYPDGVINYGYPVTVCVTEHNEDYESEIAAYRADLAILKEILAWCDSNGIKPSMPPGQRETIEEA